MPRSVAKSPTPDRRRLTDRMIRSLAPEPWAPGPPSGTSSSAGSPSSSTRPAGRRSSSSIATAAGRAGITSAPPRSGSPARASSPPASSFRRPGKGPAGREDVRLARRGLRRVGRSLPRRVGEEAQPKLEAGGRSRPQAPAAALGARPRQGDNARRCQGRDRADRAADPGEPDIGRRPGDLHVGGQSGDRSIQPVPRRRGQPDDEP